MPQLPLSTRRRLARGLNHAQIAAFRGRNFLGLGNRAMLTTSQGANSDLTFFARTTGTGGNLITVSYVDPASNSAALGVAVVGSAITVNLATDASGDVTSTAKQVRDAMLASAPASKLVWAQLAQGSDGSGALAAMAATNLAGAASRGAY